MASSAYELTACAACSDARQREIADEEDVRAELEALWIFHTKRLRADIPAERLRDRLAFSQRPPLRLAQCARCGTVRRNPVERAFTLRSVYAGETPEANTLRALLRAQYTTALAQARRLTRLLGRSGHALEVGSYAGAFLLAAVELGWNVEGIDVNESAVRFARSLGLAATTGDVGSTARDRRFDAVVFWNCFDQLPDPAAALREACARLAPGGLVAVRVPNGAFYARMRAWSRTPLARPARALLAHNNLLSFPYRHGFTVRALRRMMARCGLRVERVRGGPLVPVADEWTRWWAVWEERGTKALLRTCGVLAPVAERYAPWLEVYARAVPTRDRAASRGATPAPREVARKPVIRRRSVPRLRAPTPVAAAPPPAVLAGEPELDGAHAPHAGDVARRGTPKISERARRPRDHAPPLGRSRALRRTDPERPAHYR
ncbi:MAG TPA: class I SAM-dependent methyltransferase [Gemmatimonadaceae bacterium]|nr:class I SAM-dependent methyltransferase [Gemmatimonadaceae bacterium]